MPLSCSLVAQVSLPYNKVYNVKTVINFPSTVLYNHFVKIVLVFTQFKICFQFDLIWWS